MRRLDVFPRAPGLDRANQGLADSIFSGQRSVRSRVAPNGKSRSDVQFGKRVLLAPCPMTRASAPATFVGHVAGVVRRRSDKKVLRIHTGRVVAAVTDKSACWNWPVCKFTRKSMRRKNLARKTEDTIRRLVCRPVAPALPRPTFALLSPIHVRPKHGLWITRPRRRLKAHSLANKRAVAGRQLATAPRVKRGLAGYTFGGGSAAA